LKRDLSVEANRSHWRAARNIGCALLLLCQIGRALSVELAWRRAKVDCRRVRHGLSVFAKHICQAFYVLFWVWSETTILCSIQDGRGSRPGKPRDLQRLPVGLLGEVLDALDLFGAEL